MPTALLLLAPLLLASAQAPSTTSGVRVRRSVASMGTGLEIEVEASDRAAALSASERALRAVRACETRLSTWGQESELARLNRTPVGEACVVSEELARELDAARSVWRETQGAFDPAVGGLVRAWDLRGVGRRPSPAELEAARVPDGLAALDLLGTRAVRTVPQLVLEEGGFGKGAGLDAALAALAGEGVRAARLDLGGQLASLGEPLEVGVAHPLDRSRSVVTWTLPAGSVATSGNSERARVVDGERVGHLLDPRSGTPARDFGSVSVWAESALRADALATGLFVLGPDAALEWAATHEDVLVLVLETAVDGRLRARATERAASCARALLPELSIEIHPR